jgi:PPE family
VVDYRHQEAANATTLGGGSVPAAITPTLPTGAVPALPPPSVAAPSKGAPPASGKAIAELIHSGSGAVGLYAAAAQIRQHRVDLSSTAEQLATNANSLSAGWDSAAGRQASSRITELGAWYESHATHASSLAAALETHGDNYGRARTAVPSPDRFDDVERRLQMAIAANQAPGSPGRYAPVIVALQTELAKLNSEAIEGYANYAASAADPSVTGDPLQPPPRPSVQALDHDMPLTPPPADPPHGKDPRYWIDVTKIIHVPDGQLAPYGTVQIAPGRYYPDPSSGFTYQPPPPAAKYPLGIGAIVSTAPGQLGPSGHVLIAQTPQGSYLGARSGCRLSARAAVVGAPAAHRRARRNPCSGRPTRALGICRVPAGMVRAGSATDQYTDDPSAALGSGPGPNLLAAKGRCGDGRSRPASQATEGAIVAGQACTDLWLQLGPTPLRIASGSLSTVPQLMHTAPSEAPCHGRTSPSGVSRALYSAPVVSRLWMITSDSMPALFAVR